MVLFRIRRTLSSHSQSVATPHLFSISLWNAKPHEMKVKQTGWQANRAKHCQKQPIIIKKNRENLNLDTIGFKPDSTI